MLRTLLPALLVLCGVSTVTAMDSFTKQWEISTSVDNEDWAPGEDNSGGLDNLPPCEYIGEAAEKDCEITPSTPANPPATAPDNCSYYDWTYDAEIYMNWGCG